VAYESSGQAVAMWTQLKGDTPPSDPHDALADMEIAYAVSERRLLERARPV